MLFTKMVKSGTIRLASGVFFIAIDSRISISISQLVLIGLFGAGENKVGEIYCSSFIETE